MTFASLRSVDHPEPPTHVPAVEAGQWYLVSDDRHVHVDSRDFGQIDVSTASTSSSASSGAAGFGDGKKRLTDHLVISAQRFLVGWRKARMELELGIACGRCDWYSAMGTATCASCGLAALEPPRRDRGSRAGPALDEPHRPRRPRPAQAALQRRASPAAPASGTSARPAQAADFGGIVVRRVRRQALDPRSRRRGRGRGRRAGSEPSLEELMDQAKNYVCKSCSTPVPVGHKFCGRCGAAIPPEILNARTQFFGQLQVPGKAKLILIRGEGVEGLSYQLNADQHIVGRNGQLVFPDDPFVSPRHANLFYRGGKLVVRDEGSLQRRVLARARQRRRLPGRLLPRRRAAVPHRGPAQGQRRPRPRRHVLLLVAQAPDPVPHRADPPGRGRGHGGLRARAGAADRARGRRPELPRGPLHERVALQARGERAASSRSRTSTAATAPTFASRPSASSPTATTCSSGASCCASRSPRTERYLRVRVDACPGRVRMTAAIVSRRPRAGRR